MKYYIHPLVMQRTRNDCTYPTGGARDQGNLLFNILMIFHFTFSLIAASALSINELDDEM